MPRASSELVAGRDSSRPAAHSAQFVMSLRVKRQTARAVKIAP